MAPKRTRYAGSSSNQPTSDSNLDEEAAEKFISVAARTEYKRLMRKTLVKDRLFLVVHGEGELLQMIQDRGWDGICQLAMDIPLSIVREFYANAKTDRDGYSVVRGMRVDYTPQAISRLLALPARPEGADDWTLRNRAAVDLDAIVAGLCVPGTVWTRSPGTNEHLHFPTSSMNRYARAWNLFIYANLLPSTHQHEVNVERAILLWAIINGFYIDLGYLLNQSILRYLRASTTGSIPHGSVVTGLCLDVGVRWGEDEQTQAPSGPIDSATIQRMVEWPGGIPHPRGLGYLVAVAAGGGGVPPEVPDDVPVATQLRRMLRRMDIMNDNHTRFAQELTQSLSAAFAAGGVNVPWPVFGSHNVYPPPDTPSEGSNPGGN